MVAYRAPSFQDRATSAAQAKKKALEALRAKPKPSAEQLAEAQAARAARESAEAEKRAAAKAARAQAQSAKAAEAEAARLAAEAGKPAPPPTEAERKAARDAKYAARKNRG